MSKAAKNYLIGVLFVVIAGSLVGWLYDRPLVGLSVALALTTVWQVRQLLSFERALRTDNFARFRDGEGVWQQIFSRFRFERLRAARRKSDYRRLLKEIRKSTNAMPDGAIILDAGNEIVVSNRAAGRLVGVKRRKDRGQRIDNIVRDPKVGALVNEADHRKFVEVPSPLVEGDWLNYRVVPYGAGEKLMLIRDVTEGFKMRKMRRDFVANASHELRSPLTVISGYLDALAEDQALAENWSKPVEQMRSQAARMGNILGEMLQLSRLESAGTADKEEAINIVQLIDAVRADFSEMVAKSSIVVDISSPTELLGVRSEIESVLVNLISNAVRHTPDDGQITISWMADDNGAALSVADTGEGIAVEDIPRVTERFFRADRGRSRGDGGFGLGLAIVKYVLLRHDAELRVDSQVGVGSRFTCQFPADRTV